MNFLLEQERAYIGASSLFVKLAKLDIDPTLYQLDLPFIFSSDELRYYSQSILNDLLGKPKDEDYQYAKRICDSLSAWADKGYIVHLM